MQRISFPLSNFHITFVIQSAATTFFTHAIIARALFRVAQNVTNSFSSAIRGNFLAETQSAFPVPSSSALRRISFTVQFPHDRSDRKVHTQIVGKRHEPSFISTRHLQPRAEAKSFPLKLKVLRNELSEVRNYKALKRPLFVSIVPIVYDKYYSDMHETPDMLLDTRSFVSDK